MSTSKKFIIGISCFYHDSSVCLFKKDELIFACEEEKFTGVKHDSRYPSEVLKYIFEKYKLNSENIERVCFYEDPNLKKQRVLKNLKKNFFKSPVSTISKVFKINRDYRNLKKQFKSIGVEVSYSKHHNSHHYYSSYSSPFEKAISISIDGVGEFDTTTSGIFERGKEMDIKSISSYPHSLGLFYSAMTSFLGFKPNEGEYKVMGLSAYGRPTKYIKPLREIIKVVDGSIVCNMNVFTWDRSNKLMFNYKLSEKLGLLPRSPKEKIKQPHKDLSSAVQKRYEEIFFEIINNELSKNPDIENLCLGGGCAYNGLANGKVYEKTNIKHIWIPPSPSDAGSSVGSCIEYIVSVGRLPKIPKTPFLGPSYVINKKYKTKLKGLKSLYADNETIYRVVSKSLMKGNVVGWFKDEIEFGARALGNRSILADPTKRGMKDRINKLVKKREGFRPFAPMVTEERQKEFFELKDDVPYMNQVVKVKKEYRDKLVSVTHVDGTARVQTVYKDNQIHSLLREFEKVSSYPILLNTSFNIKDKTMVLTPEDAINTFKEVDIDLLVLQNFIIYK